MRSIEFVEWNYEIRKNSIGDRRNSSMNTCEKISFTSIMKCIRLKCKCIPAPDEQGTTWLVVNNNIECSNQSLFCWRRLVLANFTTLRHTSRMFTFECSRCSLSIWDAPIAFLSALLINYRILPTSRWMILLPNVCCHRTERRKKKQWVVLAECCLVSRFHRSCVLV